GHLKATGSTAPSYDANKAKQLLADAGWKPGSDGILVKDGKRFSITYGSQNTTSFNIQDQILQANLKAVGIDMQIQDEEQAAILDDMRRGEWPTSAMLFAAAGPDGIYATLHSKRIT